MLAMSRNACEVPISHGMSPDDDHDELPQLPIPRPGEWSPMAASQPPVEHRLSSPRLGNGLGGGASFTAASEDDPPVVDDPADVAWSNAERERIESERFTWELAARLTSGMLANPARSHSSVKDAMGLFDQFLQEMHAYAKIASEFDLLGSEAARRRSHESYFHQAAAQASTPAPPSGPTGPTAPVPQPAAPKAEPTQPRPMGDYRPIPPGARGPYAPGSMAGTPPPEQQAAEGEQAA
jgi:hypothetical protein